VLEGEAGFYHAYTGNNLGRLTFSFDGETSTDLGEIVQALGTNWLFLETLYRIYSTAGYNIAHVAVTAALCEQYDIRPAQVERLEAIVNWLETLYPSPAFPSADRMGGPAVGSTHYYSAYGVVRRGFPLLHSGEDPPEVLDLMQRVRLVPSHRQPLFAPRVTITTRDGKSFSRQGSGREFIWDFDEEARRIHEVAPGLPIATQQFDELIGVCRDLERTPRAEELVRLTLAA
jgi:hypothetical protein